MTPSLSLHDDPAPRTLEVLRSANREFSRRYPGEGGGRQPLHTVYGGGHLFRADTAAKLGAVARRALDEYAPVSLDLAGALGLPGDLADTVYRRIQAKLATEPVEDFRIDFEDGYGNRPDAEEDGHAEAAALEVAKGISAKSLPPFIGIRIKPLNEELRRRSIRTLDVFLTTLLRNGSLPGGFVVTVPKVTVPEQVAWFVDVLGELETALGLPAGTLRFELMIETPQIMVDRSGRCALPALLEAGAGRVCAAHFGTYDYTAGCNITAAYQTQGHPACDFARQLMQLAFAGTGVWLSDGSTTVMPVPVHRVSEGGPALSPDQAAANRASVHQAWALHYHDVRRSLEQGFYQGWDLHPAQLVSRYAAVYGFFLEGLEAAGARLRNFVAKAAQATLVGDIFDDAATGQGLLNYFLRGINAGALTEAEASARTGLTLEEFRGRSFVKIIAGRTAA
jgi:citrate lyase beta subunit